MYVGHFDFTVPLLGTIGEVLSADECDDILATTREWLPATVNAASGRVVNERLRDNDTAIVRDDTLAALVFARVFPWIPAEMKGQRAYGLFRPMRVYRYQAGQRFGLHNDQSYEQDGARSQLTLLVYLDDAFEGGETDFPEQQQRIRPVRGAALWFQHMLLHAGLAVTAGVKHVLRSDVLYR